MQSKKNMIAVSVSILLINEFIYFKLTNFKIKFSISVILFIWRLSQIDNV